ncbi:hypothetical protein N7527_005563 [Penicillium freii]|nr:hypothetical protein N7527_005563 [Penicillium freii]
MSRSRGGSDAFLVGVFNKRKRFFFIQSGEPLGQFDFLDKARYDITSTIGILGCTLFSQVAHEQKDSISFGLNDFYHIGDWSVEAHQEAHRADLEWLNREIDPISRLEPDRKIVVLTHYCPLTDKDVVDPPHANSKISSGFMTDLSGEVAGSGAL